MISGQRFKDQFNKMGVADYNAYYALLRFRRSVRGFRNRPVPRELIEKILEAALWARTEEDICNYIAQHIRPGLKFSV
jgi:hypothetical protein